MVMQQQQQQFQQPAVDLKSRIQGFGNYQAPPLPEPDVATTAKKVVGNLGNMLGDEISMTVDDFKKKGAIGTVTDTLADAGDLLIDGASWLIGRARGEEALPPEMDEKQ